MTKGYKNPNDYVIQKIDAIPYLWEKSGRLYFWDVDIRKATAAGTN
jgi:hypothetical protein